MGSNTNHTPTVGLVTQTDDLYIYVWNERYGKDELRFPRKSISEIEPGDIVRFLQRQDIRGVQYQMDIQPERNAYLYVDKTKNNNVPFKVRTWFAFAPPYYEPYQCLDNKEVRVVMAYSLEFGRVACFLSKVDFTPNVVYEGNVCRIPRNNNFIVDYVGTVFCLMKGFEECKDEAMVKEVLSKVPWRNYEDSNIIFQNHNDGIDEDFKQEEVIGLKPGGGLAGMSEGAVKSFLSDNSGFLPSSSQSYLCSNNEMAFTRHAIDCSNAVLTQNSALRQKDDFGGKSSFSAVDSSLKSTDVQPSLHDGGQLYNNSRGAINRSTSGRMGVSNGSDQIGIVVRLEKSYAVVWSTDNELACASELSASTMPLGTWVRFLCFEDTVEGGNIRKSVYRIEEIQPLRLSYKLGHTVKVQAFVTLAESKCHNEYFVFAQDKVLGIVLCSRDQWLVSNLRAGKEVEIFTVYMEDYQKPSRWFAIGVNRGNNEWKKLDRLPQRVDDLAEEAFNVRCSKDEDDTYNGPPPQELSVQKFRTPQNWAGPLNVTDKKIRDVLGIVVAHESNNYISVLYTTFGLARAPLKLLIGQWMRVTIVEETDLDVPYEHSSALTDRCFSVQSGQKIMPPMSTRVVLYNNAEKILLCCVITRGPTCLENNILGLISDTKQRMPIDSVPYINGYLVELMLARRKDGGIFWNVAKYHRVAQQGVDQVPLALSCYPDEIGRTCDDPHSVLVDPSYSTDAKELVSDGIRKRTEISYQSSSPARTTYDDVGIVGTLTRERLPSGSGDIDLKRGDTPAQWLFVNDKSNVVDELRRYKPAVGGTKGRGACLVVRKMDSFAVAYSKKFGLILIKPNAFVNIWDWRLIKENNIIKQQLFSKSEYDNACKPSVWIYATIVPVVYDDDTNEQATAPQSLPYKYIAVPEIKKMCNSSFLPTRVFNDFVQVEVPCKFNEETTRRVADEPTKLITTTPLGDVLLSELMYKKLELHDKETTLWVTHIREKHGCFWKLVLNDVLRGSDCYDDCVSASKIDVEALLRHRRGSSAVQQQDLLLFDEPQQPSSSTLISAQQAEAEAIFGPGFDVNSLANMGLLSSCASQPLTTSSNNLLLAQLASEELQLRNKYKEGGESSKIVNPVEDNVDEKSASSTSEQKLVNTRETSFSLESGLTTSSFLLVDNTVGGSSATTTDAASVRSGSAIPLLYGPLNAGDDRKNSSSTNHGGSSSFCEIGSSDRDNHGDGSDGSTKAVGEGELRLLSPSTSVNSLSCGDEEKKRSGSEDADNEEENTDESRAVGLRSSSMIVEQQSMGGGDSSLRQPRRHHHRAPRIDYGDACLENFSDTDEESTNGDDKLVYCGRNSDSDDDGVLQICAIEENEPLWEEHLKVKHVDRRLQLLHQEQGGVVGQRHRGANKPK